VVCLSVCHNREPCKNGWTDRDTIWVVDMSRPRKHVLNGGYMCTHVTTVYMGVQIPYVKGQFWGQKGRLVWDVDLGQHKEEACFTRGAHWCNLRIWLNRPCAVAMRPHVKLLWPLVIIRPHHPYYVHRYDLLLVCCQPSSMVWQYVTVPVVSVAKTDEPIDITFGLRTRVGPGTMH